MSKCYYRKGFTLIELLAVIVILAIILAIAVLGIGSVIETSRRNAFVSSVKLIIDGINNKRGIDGNYDVTSLTASTIKDDLGIDNDNYKTITVSLIDGKVSIDIVGLNKWEGLEASGTLTDLAIYEESSSSTDYATAPNTCFTFNSTTKTVTHYDVNNVSCPHNPRIPDTINGVTVEHIGPGAFAVPIDQHCKTNDGKYITVDLSYVHTTGDGYDYCYFDVDTNNPGPITAVKLPSHLKTIEYDAFLSNQLTSVTIPNSVTSLNGFRANQLTGVAIPNSVTSITHYAFAANRLTSITIPSSVTSLDDGAFASNQLTSAIIPNSVTSMGNAAFAGNQLTNVTIPNSITSISYATFADNQLTSVTIPSGVTSIGYEAFYNNQLTSVTIPNSVTSIEIAAFAGNQLTNVTIPSSVTNIGAEAFCNNQLTSVTIPNSVTSMGNAAFAGNQLTSVTIPSSVTSIGIEAFNGNNLPDDQAFIYQRNADGTIDNTTLVSYGGAKKDNVIIPNNVINISQGALCGDQLTSITIPSSVTNIGNYALYGNQLTSIIMGGTGTSIGNGLLSTSNDNFRTAYNSGGAGTYVGTQEGAWAKQ